MYRLVHAALASVGLRWLLPYIGAALHFGCWAGHCPWPLKRDPFDLELLDPADPFSRLALFLPITGRVGPYFMFYATVPRLLPRAFPRAFPHPLALLRTCVPAGSLLRILPTGLARHRMLDKFGKTAHATSHGFLSPEHIALRALWALSLLGFALACLHPKFRICIQPLQWALAARCSFFTRALLTMGLLTMAILTMTLLTMALLTMALLSIATLTMALVGRAYGCEHIGKEACGANVWSWEVLKWDLAAVATSVTIVVGLAALMPRRRSIFAWAGNRAFQVYVLHDCELTAPKPTPSSPPSPPFTARRIHHDERMQS